MALPSKFAKKGKRPHARRHIAPEKLRSAFTVPKVRLTYGALFSNTLHQRACGRVFRLTSLICLAIVLFIVAGEGQALEMGLYPVGKVGVDVSWPKGNCAAGAPKGAAFGIVGATGGLDFTPNRCLLNEASWFTNLSLYMNTGWPGAGYKKQFAKWPHRCLTDNSECLAYNWGFNAAEYALLYAASQNVHATNWWLDVETENSWSSSTASNRASIQGAIDAIRQNTFLPTIGIYSTPKQWRIITGGWKNGLPSWVGTGSTKRSDAVAACHDNDFTGGGTQLTQYILTLDHINPSST